MGKSSTLKRLTPLLSGLLYLTAALPAFAEQQTYALPQLVDYALRHNGDLSAFREQKGIQDAGKVKAGLLPNPTLEFDAGTGALTGSSAESSLSLGLSQEFSLAGKREKRLTVAEQELEIYRWQLHDRERIVTAEVKSAFYDLMLAEQRSVLAERFIGLNRQLLDVTNERLAAGDIPELEMNLVKVELARSEGARIDVAKTLNQNQANLWILAGLPSGESPALSGGLDAEVAMKKGLAELKQLAKEKRPDLKALEAEKTRGDADLILARAEGVPNLTAGLAVKRDTTAISLGGMDGKDTAYTVGLKLSMPIPLFDKNQAGIQEALARKSSTERRLAASRQTIEREVETAYASFLNADKVLALFRTNIIPQLEENLKLTQEAYRLGEVGILSVIQEQKNFFQVSESYLATLHSRLTIHAKLEAAVATDLSGGVQ